MAIITDENNNKNKKRKRKNHNNNKKGGLAIAPPGTVQRIGKLGGMAPHRLRGLQAASEGTRKKVSTLGGKNRHHHQAYGANFYSVISKGRGKGSEILEEYYSVEAYDSEDDDNGSSNGISKNHKT